APLVYSGRKNWSPPCLTRRCTRTKSTQRFKFSGVRGVMQVSNSMMKYVTLIFCILLIGCEKYKNYDDCYLSEIQKFKYEPSHNDRTIVVISCEIKYPYEK